MKVSPILYTTVESVKEMLNTIKMHNTAAALEVVLAYATRLAFSYEKFLETLLKQEIKSREEKRLEQIMKQASFPQYQTLDEFDLAEQNSLSKRQFNQLKELTWIEQGFNLILLGPPGVGKTML